ncbi:MAG TPA: hypothetical protein VK095_06895 [Beutenbergiaceae bacterium]|nr:hypothetical protein [Beutenbergiaceae bacterium]
MTSEHESTTSRPSLSERWQRHWYLSRVVLWLDPMPRKRRKHVLRELKANLGVAAAEDGMAAAISDLGKPRALARQYLETEPQQRPTFHHGVAAVTVALVVWVYAFAVYIFGSIDTLLAAGLTDPVQISFLGVQITTEAHDEYLAAGFTGISWVSLIAFLVIFLAFARIWRLFRRTESQPSS